MLVGCTDSASIGSLKEAVTNREVAIALAPLAGETPVTSGGVRSVPSVSKTTSTQ
jgi:hypothetical protein